MLIKERYLPTRPSKPISFLLMGTMVCLYLLQNSSISSIIDGGIFSYIVMPLLWLTLAFLVWFLPKVHPKGLLRLKSFLKLWSFNFAIAYILISVIAGFIDGFGKSPYSHSFKGVIMNIFLITSVLLGRELIRNYIINSLTDNENYLFFLITALFMTITNISLNSFTTLKGYAKIVEFTARYFAPEFCRNFLANYLVFLGGPASSIIYIGVIEAVHWLSPVLPNLKWITQALVGILCPVFSLMFLQNMYIGVSKKGRKREVEKENPISWMITSIVSIGIIWFSVGVFPIYPSVIATGSMEPMIKPGDVILIKKTDNVKLNDVVQYKKDDILIAHRIIDIVEDEKGKSYRTKGDNNSVPDFDLVNGEQIKGKVVKVVPKIGWPTLLIKSKRDVPLEKVEF